MVWKKCWLWLGLVLVLFACGPRPEAADQQDWRTAPFPTVLRSVLDHQPRMISVRLSEGLYMAYSAEACAPVKIWRGGLALHGAAYDDIKTVQPSAWGRVLWQDPDPAALWSRQAEDQALPLRPVFLGYRLDDPLPTFLYKIPLPYGRELPLTEKLSLEPRGDAYLLTRAYRVADGNVPPAGVIIGGQALVDGELIVRQELEPGPMPPPPAEEVTASSAPLWLDRSGCNTCHAMQETTIGPSYRQIAARYEEDDETIDLLTGKVRRGGRGAWGPALMNAHPHLAEADIRRMVRYILSLDPDPDAVAARRRAAPADESTEEVPMPGFGAALQGLHPALSVTNLRPEGFRPRVGGLAFFSDGRLALSTWDSVGAVYILDNVTSGDASRVGIRRFAAGLHEPLGLEIVDDEVYVLQKQELTKLIDHDGDGRADEYRAICHGFDASADFHEFSYGLAYRDGHFYATLGLAMRLMQNERQLPDRGTTIRMDTLGGFEIVHRGLRQPNGIGTGVDGELFVLENQGQWVPASKLIHVRAGDFHGCRFHQGGRFDGLAMTPPAVWLPQDEIGNSPSEPVPMIHGPYRGQMLHGEVTHGGIKRVFLEKVGGAYQGAVFRFTQGLEAGINRLAWGPDGALYAGGVGMNGNWGWGGRQYSLQRLEYRDRTAFEMLELRARPRGLAITFTEPLAEGSGETPEAYTLEQWRYEPTPRYGGPKLDHETLTVEQVEISADRKRVELEVPGLRAGRVVYLLLDEDTRSGSGQRLWSGEAWYTLNAIPE